MAGADTDFISHTDFTDFEGLLPRWCSAMGTVHGGAALEQIVGVERETEGRRSMLLA